MKSIRVTVLDLETGEEESQEVFNDYILICTGDTYLSHVTKHANGTHVLTVKRDKVRGRREGRMSDDRPTTQTTYREPLQPTTDLRARLDAAITAAWTAVYRLRLGTLAHWEDALNRYTALVELRARWDEHGLTCSCAGATYRCDRGAEIEADVRRRLPVDGSAEAHSGRKSDQLSG